MFKIYIHSIPLVEYLPGKGEKKLLLTCLRRRVNTTLITCLPRKGIMISRHECIHRNGDAHIQHRPYWKLEGLKRRTDHKHTSQLTLLGLRWGGYY